MIEHGQALRMDASGRSLHHGKPGVGEGESSLVRKLGENVWLVALTGFCFTAVFATLWMLNRRAEYATVSPLHQSSGVDPRDDLGEWRGTRAGGGSFVSDGDGENKAAKLQPAASATLQHSALKRAADWVPAVSKSPDSVTAAGKALWPSKTDAEAALWEKVVTSRCDVDWSGVVAEQLAQWRVSRNVKFALSSELRQGVKRLAYKTVRKELYGWLMHFVRLRRKGHWVHAAAARRALRPPHRSDLHFGRYPGGCISVRP